MKKLALFAVLFLAALGLVGCKKDDTFTVSIASEPDTIDPALNTAVDGATYLVHLFEGLVKYVDENKDGLPELVPGIAKAIPEPVALEDGKVSYTFELREDARWSDGTFVDAFDFVYSWNRAAHKDTGADYQYMFDVIDGYEGVAEGEEGAELNVHASPDGTKLTVVLKVDVPYFMELCAFPTYFPVQRHTVIENGDKWATDKDFYVNNGPYVIEKFDSSELVLVKNEYYYNKDAIKLERIAFVFSDDDNNNLANYKNGTYKLIDSVPNDEISALKEQYPDEFVVTGQLGTYFVVFNVNDETLGIFSEPEQVKIRKALSLLINRNYIVKNIGQAEQQPANGFVPSGLTEPDGKEFVEKNGPNRDGKGYYSVEDSEAAYEANCQAAINLLKEVAASSGKFTVGTDNKLVGFPQLIYAINEGTGHTRIAEYLQATFSNYGIDMKIEKYDWNTFLDLRKKGDFSVARHGWLGDYNDPISFLDMWTSNSGNNDAQLGKDGHASYAGYSYKGQNNLTWAQSYDELIKEIKAEKDATKRFELMHQAEDLLMSTGAIVPIYYYTDIYMIKKEVKGFFSSPLGYKFFMYVEVE